MVRCFSTSLLWNGKEETTSGRGGGDDEPTAANVTMKFRYRSKVGRVGKQIQLAIKELAFVRCRNESSIFLVCREYRDSRLSSTMLHAETRINDEKGENFT